MTNDIRAEVQKQAVSAALKAFKKQHRGKVIMPCGTGKTRVGLQVMDGLKCDLTLVLCPALALVQQNLNCYLENSKKPFESLVVCSDDSVLHEARDDYGIESQATTSPAVIREVVRSAIGRLVIFGTYQSVAQIAAAWKRAKLPKFDLIVFDEAHRTAGQAGVFSAALHDKQVPAVKRLFLTATPRTMRAAEKTKANADGIEVVCMDDKKLYGDEVYRLDFSKAIELGLLTDYQVIIFGVTKEMVRLVNEYSGDESKIAAVVGLIKAMQKFKIRKVISYHSSTRRSRNFSEKEFLPLFESMKARREVVGGAWCRPIAGTMPVRQRKVILDELSNLPARVNGVVSNCRVLGEGVDAPAVDGVAFMDPKNSVIDITQAIGRCMRLCEGKHKSYVIVPVFLPDDSDEIDAESSARWKTVVDVIRALRDHDSRIEGNIELHKNGKYIIENPIELEDPLFKTVFPQISTFGLNDALLKQLQPRLMDAVAQVEWSVERIHKLVKTYISQHKTSPHQRSGPLWKSADVFLRTHFNSSLPKWLDANGYGRARQTESWSEERLHDLVKQHFIHYGNNAPTSGHKKFNAANQFLMRSCNTTLPKWLDANGYGRARQTESWSEERLHDLVKQHFIHYGSAPFDNFGSVWLSASRWINRTFNITLPKWLDANGYGRAKQTKSWSEYLLHDLVKQHFIDHRSPPSEKYGSVWLSASRWLRNNHKSSLAKWLDENGYGRASTYESWSDERLHEIVRRYREEHQQSPSSKTSKLWRSADIWLRNNHKSSLAKWLDENGHGRARQKKSN